jgi:hypothetical protein
MPIAYRQGGFRPEGHFVGNNAAKFDRVVEQALLQPD